MIFCVLRYKVELFATIDFYLCCKKGNRILRGRAWCAYADYRLFPYQQIVAKQQEVDATSYHSSSSSYSNSMIVGVVRT
jgi:hypothetical protein